MKRRGFLCPDPAKRPRKTSGIAPADCRCPLVGCFHRWRATLPAPKREGGLTCSFQLRTCSIVPPYLLRRLAAQQKPELSRAAHGAKQALQHVRSLPGLPRRARPRQPPRACGSSSRPRRNGPSTTPSPPRSCPAAWSAKKANRPPAIPPPMRPTTGWGTPTASTPKPSAAIRSTATACPLMPRSTSASLYDNAFWDGQQMVFGDGDGQVFERFTKSLSVIGHELTHGVTQYSAGLAYRNQAGALNESMSDVFGALVEQYVRKQSDGGGQLADRRRPLHGPGAGRRPALHEGAGNRVRRRRARQGPAAGLDGLLRAHQRGQRRRAHQLRHPQPRVLPGGHGPRRQCLGGAGHRSGTRP